MLCSRIGIKANCLVLIILPNILGRALSISRLGGRSFISICGAGETLIPKETPAIIYNILQQGHFINVTTNGTVTKRFQEIISFPTEYFKATSYFFFASLCGTSENR